MGLFDELNSLADLQSLIDSDERESDVLEYKTARKRLESKDRDEAAKDISAFANASGGVLIYGVATDAKDKTKPVMLDPIDPWNVNYLLHTISSAIWRPIAGIRHKTFPGHGTPQALLLDVPQSPVAPHQVAGDRRYYHRQGVESVPMTHDLVELHFGRRMNAKLEPRIESSEPEDPDADSRVTCRLKLSLLNTGGQIGRDVFTRIVAVRDRAAALNVEGQYGELRGEIDPRWPEGPLFSHRHIDLYYPGVRRLYLAFTFRSHTGTIGPEKPVLFLDVYAADTRPYRYNLFRTFQIGEGVQVGWEEAGLPPTAT